MIIRRRLKKKPGMKSGQVIGVRAKRVDPDTNQVVWETLDDVAMPKDETQVAWAKTKSVSIRQRRGEIAGGSCVASRGDDAARTPGIPENNATTPCWPIAGRRKSDGGRAGAPD